MTRIITLPGRRLSKPRGIIMMMLLGFEADILEISLREQLEMVNKVFIVEATANHRGMTKPLLWERLKFSPRFSFIDRAKVEHVVVDDRVMNSGLARVEEWWAENRVTELGVERARYSQSLSATIAVMNKFSEISNLLR